MNERFVIATKEVSFEGEGGDIRAVMPKGAEKAVENLSEGYAFDNSSINIKSFDVEGNLGVIQLDITSTCMGALSLGDQEVMYMGLEEAKELRKALDAAIGDAESTLEELWEKKEALCPI